MKRRNDNIIPESKDGNKGVNEMQLEFFFEAHEENTDVAAHEVVTESTVDEFVDRLFSEE